MSRHRRWAAAYRTPPSMLPAILAMILSINLSTILPCAAVAADSPPVRTIHATGHGSSKVVPDRARVSVSVTTRAASAREASEANARQSKDVLEKLRAAVRAPGEVRTSGYELSPVYEYPRDGGVVRAPKVSGYTATNRFAIVSADLAGVGALIDSTVASGATQIDSIGFYLDDEAPARREALLEAGRKARAEAETIAQSLGVHLGDVVDASSTTSVTPVVYARSAMAMDSAAATTEVAPGTVDIGADISVTFAIQ